MNIRLVMYLLGKLSIACAVAMGRADDNGPVIRGIHVPGLYSFLL